MHIPLAGLVRLLNLYYQFRPLLTALFFSLLLGITWTPVLAQEARALTAATADASVRTRKVTAEKILPELSLGELIQALSNKWAVRVPENLHLDSAAIILPKANLIRPTVRSLDETRSRTVAASLLKGRELMHPLELRFEPGIKNSPTTDSLQFAQAEWLISSLRSISGFQDLTFDERGVLVLGGRIAGGSELARRLLRAALESSQAFEIESQEGSDLIIFGAFMTLHFRKADGKTAKINKIQLDFHDFNELRGAPRLIEAFDPGFVFLHELAHGVWDLPDDEKGGLGECEAFINRIRRQLGLPQRVTYFYKVRRQLGGGELGEMMFVQPADGARRQQFLKLLWDNRAVNSYIRPAPSNATPLSAK